METIVPEEGNLMHRHLNGPTIAVVAVFAAFIAASTAVPEVTLAFGVPLSLQTFAVVLAALSLGPWRAAAAMSLYLVVGLAGAPIFANFRGGPSVFAGPTGGYLIGMLVATVVVGALVAWRRRRGPLTFLSLLGPGLVSIPVIYAIGVPWLAARTGLPVLPPAGCTNLWTVSEECVNALTVGVVPFLPGDIIKVLLAALAAAVIHRAYPQLLPAPALRADAVTRESAATA
ncbi:biotin transporter BioY [Demequina sp. SO4-18]|uniref:biotin transporter BioY n=1 Tax=Demequina sp. SO4-18 TaxID=3401026 RepID=UPI003B5C1F4C